MAGERSVREVAKTLDLTATARREWTKLAAIDAGKGPSGALTHGAIDAVVERMAGAAFWQDEGIWRAIVARLPEYRLSKFQRALPAAASMELVGGYMLDATGTQGYLCRT